MCNDTPAIRDLVSAIEAQNRRIETFTSIILDAQRRVRKYVDERLFSLGDTTINVPPSTSNPILVTSIIVYVTSAATLYLGDRSYTLSPTSDNDAQFKSIQIVLRQSDKRQLVQAASGAMSLEIMGEELATSGVW